MGLNLDSLKNLSTTPLANANITGESTTPPLTPPTTPAVFSEEKIATTGPKISLLKLKKASWTESSVIPIAIKQDVDQWTETQTINEIPPTPVVVNTVEEETISVLPVETISINAPAAEIITTERVAHETWESESIVMEMEIVEVSEKQETKEFFPKFQIAKEMHLDKDLWDLENLIATKEQQVGETTPEETESIIPATECVLMKVESLDTDTSDSDSLLIQKDEKMAEETIIPLPEVSLEKSIAPNSEYVAEVKAELSEQRRAGFRFFIQKKTKIIAGISLLILSISAVTFFSGSLLPDDIQKSGKTNIQEGISDIKQKTNDLGSEWQKDIPTIESTIVNIPDETRGYEMGRDYSVSKNTKKNIRSKAPSDTSSGTNIPTP